MITKFTCDCGNTDPKKAKDYDGSLGYEAMICTVCGTYYDESGTHAPDDWSKQFIGSKSESLPVAPMDKVDQQRFLKQTDRRINPDQRNANEFTSMIAWQIFYARYQSLHMQMFGSYLLPSHEIYDSKS
jgi:hypothetical protein